MFNPMHRIFPSEARKRPAASDGDLMAALLAA
jgi:hypothetical protein